MPELPEVETICRGLKSLINKKVFRVFRSEKNLRINSTLNLTLLEHKFIIKINRRARYLIIDFSDNLSLIMHLGMSGRALISDDQIYHPKKHDHFICEFIDGKRLIFNDPRRFGFVDLIYTKNLIKHKMLSKLGFEPLEKEFNTSYLATKLQTKKMNIKTTMMNNEIVVGVGNIYINESLFIAKISPLRLAFSLSKEEIARLIAAIKSTLKKAIELGGSSINDYVSAKGEAGIFQNNFKVYGRNLKKCLLCNNKIQKILQNGRSSFYCSNCQK